MRIMITTVLLMAATTSQADITARFIEGAPKDRFEVTNAGGCALPAGDVTIDIGTAPAGLIFDVTASGAGVEVFQPFELVAGGENLSTLPQVADGDQAIRLPLTGLAPDATIAFTIDVDDTSSNRQITVNGSEIAGATIRASFGNVEASGTFDTSAKAVLKLACMS